MSHSSEKRWDDVSREITGVCTRLSDLLNHGEETYLRLLEVWTYTGGTPAAFAQQLFQTSIPTTEQLAMANDAVAAMVALHELYLAATGAAVTTQERLSALRRMI